MAYSTLVLTEIATAVSVFELYLAYLDREDKKKEQQSGLRTAPIIVAESATALTPSRWSTAWRHIGDGELCCHKYLW
jgi:hypothetical protein